jgi:trimeric autotransporter adhesin
MLPLIVTFAWLTLFSITVSSTAVAQAGNPHEPGTVITIAGNGVSGFSGDGGSATSAQLSLPFGIDVDAAGNIYISDTFNHRVRKVSLDGSITTIAGTGTAGFSGDGGPATTAKLDYPFGVAVDGAGNLYIADSYNYRIRRVSTGGIITTVAGSGPAGKGNGGFAGDGGQATSARLDTLHGVAVDKAGNLYFTEQGNSKRLRRVNPQGSITTVTVGDSNHPLKGPAGISVDRTGNILVADFSDHRVRSVTPTGTITTVAGCGWAGYEGDGDPATRLPNPIGAVVDPFTGQIFVPGGARLNSPFDVAAAGDGSFYIADFTNNVVRAVDSRGILRTTAGMASDSSPISGYWGDGGPAAHAAFDGVGAVVLDKDGNLLIADSRNSCIRKVFAVAVPMAWERGVGPGGADDVPPPPIMRGDLNGDGQRNISDVTLALRFAVGLEAPTVAQLAAGDLNGNGVIDITDVTLILRAVVGLAEL